MLRLPSLTNSESYLINEESGKDFFVYYMNGVLNQGKQSVRIFVSWIVVSSKLNINLSFQKRTYCHQVTNVTQKNVPSYYILYTTVFGTFFCVTDITDQPFFLFTSETFKSGSSAA